MKDKSFIDTLLPGNYNLTKSYEITKITTSGTLWYTKKFLVLYNIVFLSNALDTTEYLETANNIFNSYIASLNPKVQEDARELFFNGHDEFNLSNTKSFNQFRDSIDYKDRSEAIKENMNAKKYYFTYLMVRGGQSGVKKEINDSLYQKDFKFSNGKLREIVLEYNVKNNTKYSVSGIISDSMAFIRNERQVLYYYGFFHSKSVGSNDREFSSLTPIGELAFAANSIEFQTLWEHQKLKMISQPPNVTITGVAQKNVRIDSSNFSINYSPYFDLLKYLNKYKTLTPEVYQYLLSRNKENKNLFNENVPSLVKNIEQAIEQIKGFNRPGDVNKEDFSKELKKYLLGITNDFKLDKKTNNLAIIEGFSGDIKIMDKYKFNIVYNSYKAIDEYKRERYSELFSSVNEELKEYYENQLSNNKYIKNQKVQTEWNLYNGKIEDSILMNIMFLFIELELKKNEREITIKEFVDNFKKLFPNISSYFSLKNDELKDIYNMKRNSGFIHIKDDLQYEHENQEVDRIYQETSTKDLKHKILELSEYISHYEFTPDRKRNTALVLAMKNYYMKVYDNGYNVREDTTIRCECCNKYTFIMNSNKPYMEFHHIIPFGGETKGQDHYLNLINLCPTCHTQIHWIHAKDKSRLYSQIDRNNYIEKTIKNRLIELKRKNLLKSYQLEFLLAEQAITEENYNEIGEYDAK